MEKSKRKKWKYVVVGGCLFFIFLILGTCTGGVFSPFPCLYLPSFKGKVIDADTKEPISGAVVLAVYFKEWTSVAGSNSFAVDGQETLTGEKGEFSIPLAIRWLTLYRGYSRGKVIIFKPGYGAFPNNASSSAVGENKTWPPPEKYVVYKLPKMKTREERRSNLHFQYYEGFGDKIFLNFLTLIDEEYINLGLPGISIPKKEK